MRAISRVVDVSINTVTKLLVEAGEACAAFHFEKVQGVRCQHVQCDEIWSFCYSKEGNTSVAGKRVGRGDLWTWTAIDAHSKLIISWMIGGRDGDTDNIFIQDLKDRLANRVQLTTDGHRPYLTAVEKAFDQDVDYAMLVKLYGRDSDVPLVSSQRRYSAPEIIGTRYTPITGAPDERYASTSYSERHNLTMRMSMRRFTRLTNAFSKKVDNHCHALALYFLSYNWIRIHKTLKVTPAMAAGLTDKLMSWEEVVALIDAREAARRQRAA
jgi:IS1 family transposase